MTGHGRARRGGAEVHQGVQCGRDVEVSRLEPVGQFLVGEAVPGPGGDQQALGEHGRGPAGPPGEQLLEGGPVQLALPRPEAAAGGLVQPPRDPGGEPPHPGPVHTRTVHPASLVTGASRRRIVPVRRGRAAHRSDQGRYPVSTRGARGVGAGRGSRRADPRPGRAEPAEPAGSRSPGPASARGRGRAPPGPGSEGPAPVAAIRTATRSADRSRCAAKTSSRPGRPR